MPSQTYAYPTVGEFMQIEQDLLPSLRESNPGFKHFPDEMHDSAYLEWEVDDYTTGLQQIRGMDGEPPRVRPLGRNRYHAEPGIYGEYTEIDEKQLTTRRDVGVGPMGRPMPTASMIDEKQLHLLQRRISRQSKLIWDLMALGRFTVLDARGVISHQDAFLQTVFTATVPWATVATATPLADLRSIQILGRGTSNMFDGGASAYMNRTTANAMLGNTNAADIGGKKTTGLASLTSLADYNRVFAAEGLPQIEVFDDGYLDETTGAFTLFIPNNTVVVVGRRPGGQPPGAYMYTRNAQNPNTAPGPYTIVDDNAEKNEVPRHIRIHDGHNGGPCLRRPGQILRMVV